MTWQKSSSRKDDVSREMTRSRAHVEVKGKHIYFCVCPGSYTDVHVVGSFKTT